MKTTFEVRSVQTLENGRTVVHLQHINGDGGGIKGGALALELPPGSGDVGTFVEGKPVTATFEV